MAAGLAGGSADGAGVLYILNRLYKTGFDEFTLCSIGEKVGADVPFSLTGGTSLCVDTGGVIAPLPAISDCFIVLCKPDMGVSTVNAYKQIDEAQRIRHADRTAMLYAMKTAIPRLCTKNEQCFRAGDRGTETPVYQTDHEALRC